MLLACKSPLFLDTTKTLVLFVLYLVTGWLVYTYGFVETKGCESADALAAHAEMLANQSASGEFGSVELAECTEPWTAIDALYFSMATMSTVGYGDFSPSTWYSQIFTIFYIFIGIVAVFTQLSSAMMIVFTPLFDLTKMVTTFMLPGEDPLDVDGDGTYDFVMPQAAWIYYTKNMFGPMSIVILVQVGFAPISLRSPLRSRAALALTSLRSRSLSLSLSLSAPALCGVQLLFALIFSEVEPGWDYGLAFYHCLVTATTVGYGDVSITTEAGRIVATVHILLSVVLLGAIIGEIDTLRVRGRAAARTAPDP